MNRNTRRMYLVIGCIVSLSLVHMLWPAQAAQQHSIDAKILDTYVARNVGPANMGGRVVDIAGVDSDPKTVYVATASGGLWKTTDGGDTWTPIFDHQTSICIGDVAVSQSNPNIIWVGTGEQNPRNSVAWGDGIYKSTDGGKTWTHMGLKDSHSIGRIAIHPTNPDIVYVGVLGHMWGPNKERGVFKTTDGGKTWNVSKFIDEKTGIIDLKIDPSDPETLYAAAYCVRRDAFSGGNPAVQFGPEAGLYKTNNGGKTWAKMTEGLPKAQYGRCGIDIYAKDPNVVYAVIQTNAAAGGGSENGPLVTDKGGVFRSRDKGATWEHMNSVCPRPFYYGQIRVDPTDDNRVYVLGVSFYLSDDGGKKFATGAKSGGVHVDHHALWVSPKDSNDVWLGNDGGVYHSRDKAKNFPATRAFTVCQFYGISCDMSKPYFVYGGLQDNGAWGGPSATYDVVGIRQNLWFKISGGDGFHTANDPTDPNIVYTESQNGGLSRVNVTGKGGKGGKGGVEELFFPGLEQASQDQKKADQKKDDPKKDDPKKEEQKKGGKGGGGIKPAGNNRWNWSTPMLISPHNPSMFYCGSQFLYRSVERGLNPKQISPDLTHGAGGGGKGGGGAHSLFTISESPSKRGVLWTGSDDGRIHISKDDGGKWTDVSKIPGMPKDSCISRVEASAHADGTAYVSITRYRNDDRKPYIFKTTDYGANWESITGNLPESGSVHVVIESSRNKNLLFCGTEFGLFASFDGGKVWNPMKGGLPTVAVHDIVIHPRDRDLVIGTHGRGIYIFDDISPLETVTAQVAEKPAHLFDVRPAVAHKVRTTGAKPKSNEFVGQNPPYGAIIQYHSKAALGPGSSLTILDATSGKKVATLKVAGRAGLQQTIWNLRADGEKEATVSPGEYLVVLETGDHKQYKMLRVNGE